MIEVIAAIASVLTIGLGLLAESMRRKWVQSDKKAVENAHKIAELLAQRDAGWRSNDPGRVFNPKD